MLAKIKGVNGERLISTSEHFKRKQYNQLGQCPPQTEDKALFVENAQTRPFFIF